MRSRSTEQWLEMIARTRPSHRAVTALDAELRQDRDLSQDERETVQRAIADLAARVDSAPAEGGTTAELEMLLDYRPEAQGGRGRLYLEIAGREQVNVGEPCDLRTPGVYLFSDEDGLFSGLQVDAAKELGGRLAGAVAELDSLTLPLVDCPQAGLRQTRVAEVLGWAATQMLGISQNNGGEG